MPILCNGQPFPRLRIAALGGGSLDLPGHLAGRYGIVLVYRGSWCPFCNEQMAAFVAAAATLQRQDIGVVAFSVEDEAAAAAFVAALRIPFPVGHSASIPAITEATGACENASPVRGRFLESTGFVLAPDGTVDCAVYSTRAIGRLVPEDALRLVAFLRSRPT